jgi:hypothetical protein
MLDRRIHYRNSIDTCLANADYSLARDTREMWVSIAASYLFLLHLHERDAACPLCPIVPASALLELTPDLVRARRRERSASTAPFKLDWLRRSGRN